MIALACMMLVGACSETPSDPAHQISSSSSSLLVMPGETSTSGPTTSIPSTTSSNRATTTTTLRSTGPIDCEGEPGVWQEGVANGRLFRATVPAGAGNHPVILEFHGFAGTAFEQSEVSGLGELAADAGFAVVVFDGQGQPGRSLRWDLDGGFDSDVAFIDFTMPALLPCAGPVFATGFSNGAAFASVLGCESELEVIAVATVSWATEPCDDGSRLPIVAFHGTADGTVPFDGDGNDVLEFLLGLGSGPAEAAIGDWARQNGCTDFTVNQIGPDVEYTQWVGCEAETGFYRIINGGHSWPGSEAEVQFGATTQTIVASSLIIEFFLAQLP